MLAAYGVDVLDPGVTPRRVWVLATRLPPWAQAPGEAWSQEAALLALIVDHLANLTYVTLRAAGAKSVPKPRPLPRPKARAASQPHEPSGPARAKAEAAPGGWFSAAQQLAVIPGVVVKHGGGDG